MMKKSVTLLALLLSLSVIQAQIQIKKSSISTDGGSSTTGSKQIVYSVGEATVNEYNISSIQLSEGFVNPDIIQANGLENYTEITGFSYYPNPASNEINLVFPNEHKYQILLYSVEGKQISETYRSNHNNKLYLEALPVGNYLLLVIDRKSKKQKIVKIQKQ